MNISRRIAALAASAAVCLIGLGFGAQPARATCEFPRMLYSASQKVIEGTGPGTKSITFKVTSSSCSHATKITYATSGTTAIAGSDYVGKSGTLSWASGDSTPRYVTVTVLRDSVPEADETFKLRFFNPNNNFVDLPTGVVGTILNDDVAIPK